MWPSLKQVFIRRLLTEKGWFCPRSKSGPVGTYQLPRYPKDYRKKAVVYVAYVHPRSGVWAHDYILKKCRAMLVRKDDPMRVVAHIDYDDGLVGSAQDTYRELMLSLLPKREPREDRPREKSARPMSSRSMRTAWGSAPVPGDKIAFADADGDMVERRVKRVIRQWPDGQWEVEGPDGERFYVGGMGGPRSNPDKWLRRADEPRDECPKCGGNVTVPLHVPGHRGICGSLYHRRWCPTCHVGAGADVGDGRLRCKACNRVWKP